uniref:ATP synthase subunit a n=1 Tax=Candida bohioensis TaxID=561986 RepID=U3MGL8_9ASCO|nr:ATP synthase F0 subunit 6 [Candida bohioensis]AGW07354.1 ATP synthase F0 subunit 6 [Candida bohioensis]
MLYSPLDQFEVKPLTYMTQSLAFSMTNFTLYLAMVLSMLTLYFMMIDSGNLGSTRWGVAIMAMYDTMLNLVTSQMGGTKSGYYFPLMFSMFNMMLLANLTSMMPYSFAMAAQLVAIVGLSLALWLGNLILGLSLHGSKFFSLFVPSGTPLILVPVLVLIECLSYCSRAISLGLRLSANILSGHLTMTILGSLILGTMGSSIYGFMSGIMPMTGVVAITMLEFGIAIMQAYVFSILLSGYMKDSVSLH